MTDTDRERKCVEFIQKYRLQIVPLRTGAWQATPTEATPGFGDRKDPPVPEEDRIAALHFGEFKVNKALSQNLARMMFPSFPPSDQLTGVKDPTSLWDYTEHLMSYVGLKMYQSDPKYMDGGYWIDDYAPYFTLKRDRPVT